MTGAFVGVLFDGFAYGMLLFILSVGLSVTLGMMNFINLAHCSFAMLGGYVTVTLMDRLGWPFLATLPVAFVASAFQLGPLCGWLSPLALAIVFWYSLAKRFTTYTQFFLGLAMAVAPVGGWIAAGGRGGPEPWLLGLAIGLWVGGFDILYACQDVDFDRRHGLRSIPATYGVANAIRISRLMHLVTIVVMASLWWAADLPPLYLAGVAIVAALLAYEQSLVSDDDLSQVKKAFDLNGWVGIVYFAVTALALYIG